MNPAFKRLVDLVKFGLGWSQDVVPLADGEEKVWKLAREHRVYNILSPRILELEQPRSLVDEARFVWHFAALREEFYGRECERIVSQLESQGVKAFPLKGIRLAKEVYPKKGLRPYRDIDLLVSPAQVIEVDRLLKNEGFVEIHPKGPLPRAKKVRGNSSDAAAAGLDAVSYEKGNLNLEIHTRLLPPSLGEYPMEEIWKRGFSPEDFFIHLTFHTTRHHFLFGLRHLVDLSLWFQKVNTDVVVTRLQEARLLWLAFPAWKLASELFAEQAKSPPVIRNKSVNFYTNRIRTHLDTMPINSIGLAGSPLPFLLMRKKGLSGLAGSNVLRDYQIGSEKNFFDKALWKITRPIEILWRHSPILWNWLKFSFRTS